MPVPKTKIRVAITMGDPSGIGPAILAKALKELAGKADFTVIGDKGVFDMVKTPASKFQDYDLINLNNVCRKGFKFGRPKPEYAKAAIKYLDKALDLIQSRQVDCLVTCPVSKELITLAGFTGFRGHTEYLAKAVKARHFAMMLMNSGLKVTLATRHIAIKDIPSKINKDDLYKTIALTHKALKELFGFKNPRLVVCGLNPHASDRGLMGNEESKIITPAISALRKKIKNIIITGPLPADVAFLKAVSKDYDCVIAMYHDQALIPLKVTGPSSGVNITLGLGFVRTSPLHGTAFDIAGKYASADPGSLIEAINTAIRCTLNLKKA